MNTNHHLKIRIARPTNQLRSIAEMYCRGLNLEILGHFEDHAGFDGIMVVASEAPYHFEFTQERGHIAPRCPTKEHLVVFYIPNSVQWDEVNQRMRDAGFVAVRSHNPYWNEDGQTFEDLEGYRVVLSRDSWIK